MLTEEKSIEITYNKKIYKIRIEKLLMIIRQLKADDTIKFENDEQIIKTMRELKLCDDIFLGCAKRI